MVYRGHVRNGKIELDRPTTLPEGAAVEIILPLAAEGGSGEAEAGPTLYERLKPFIGSAQGLPPDASINVDHYLYGHPKQ